MLSTIFSPRLALLILLSSNIINAMPLFGQFFRRTNEAHPLHSPRQQTCPTPLSMGAASFFAALGASTLTSTGSSYLAGDAGVFPGTSVTGFPPGIVSGTIYSAGEEAEQGETACKAAYNEGVDRVASATTLEAELGGVILSPGIYTFASAAELTGNLTLDGSDTCGGGQFIFIIPTTLTTAAASTIILWGEAKACNVYFLMGTSATVGAESSLQGNFIASASISAGEAARNVGTFCALNAAITLINNGLTSQGQCNV